MTETSLTTLFGGTTVVQALLWLLAAGALLFLVVKVWPKIRAFVATVDALAVLPAKLQLLDEIHHEVKPNTGTSLNDSVRRTEAGLEKQAETIAEISAQVAGLQLLMESGDEALNARVDELEDTLTTRKEC